MDINEYKQWVELLGDAVDPLGDSLEEVETAIYNLASKRKTRNEMAFEVYKSFLSGPVSGGEDLSDANSLARMAFDYADAFLEVTEEKKNGTT